MKTRLVLLFALLNAVSLFAQIKWQGGFPGRENDWFCARNWSSHRVPDQFDSVVIPDVSTRGSFFPVINRSEAIVQSLVVESNARLTIQESAELHVLGYNLSGGALLNQGTLINHGLLQVVEPVLHAVEYSGNGTLIQTRSELTPDKCEIECL